MTSRCMHRRLASTLLTVGVLTLGADRVVAQELLRLSYQVAGDAKPVLLHADQITTWVEGNHRVLVLQGKVLVEHGVLHARMQQAVVWVDQERSRKTGITYLDVYAEGEVSLEKGAQARSGPRALVDLSTRGEVRIQAHNGKVVQQSLRQEPLYQRGEAARQAANSPPPSSPIQPISHEVPAPGPPSPPPADPGPPSSTADPGPEGDRPQPLQLAPGRPGPARPTEQAPLDYPGPALHLQPPVAEPPAPSPAAPPPAGGPPPASLPAVPADPPPGSPGGSAPRSLSIQPRTSKPYEWETFQVGGEQVVLFTGGVILQIRTPDRAGILDIEADRLVLWTKEDSQQLLRNLRTPQGQLSRESEFYLAGNVEIRRPQPPDAEHTLRADAVYYDASRDVAVALSGDLEIKRATMPDPVHLKADELLQLSPRRYEATNAEVYASKLPSDPGLKVYFARATVTEQTRERRGLFGTRLFAPALAQTESRQTFRGTWGYLKVEDIPILPLPFLQGDVRDPLGPLQEIRFGQDRVFGTQLSLTFDVFDLLGLEQPQGIKWRLETSYLSQRGPAAGTIFEYAGQELFGIPGKYQGDVRAFGIHDTGKDVLGGGRGETTPHPDFRGRFVWRQNWQDLPEDLTLQWMIAAYSDKNFFEQFYKWNFDSEINQETYFYLKQQRDQYAATLLLETRIREWVTETEWLPRVDGHVLGQSLFDLFTYNTHASAGYARFRTTDLPPPAVLITDVPVETGRFDWWQELSLPFSLGPFRLVPYGVLDLTYYTDDLTGDDRLRLYGGGGLRGSLPLARLYPDVQSNLFNVNGLYHKMVLGANYYIAGSDTSFTRLPQLDRLDDDATDQARRDFRPVLPQFNPEHGLFLATSPLFDPQRYAIRRLLSNRLDTRDDIEVLQADLRQRWQTKRGYPGREHTVDVVTLNTSASFFPHPTRDASGTPLALLEYQWLWHLGDRTSLASTGWIDPVDNGARVFTLEAFLNRPDRTEFYLGYRLIEPVNSQGIYGAVRYIFSPKYSLRFMTNYDFGTNQTFLRNMLAITRTGKDLQVTFGLDYDAILNNVGVTFEILPNLMPGGRGPGGFSPFNGALSPQATARP